MFTMVKRKKISRQKPIILFRSSVTPREIWAEIIRKNIGGVESYPVNGSGSFSENIFVVSCHIVILVKVIDRSEL